MPRRVRSGTSDFVFVAVDFVAVYPPTINLKDLDTFTIARDGILASGPIEGIRAQAPSPLNCHP